MTEPRVIDMPLYVDDRGTVHCAFDNMHNFGIRRTYIIRNWAKGMIRAWHLHMNGNTYFHVIDGVAKIAALKYDPKAYWSNEEYIMTIDNPLTIVILSSEKPQLFMIPKGFYNGFSSLMDNTKILVYSTLSFADCENDNKRLSSKAFKEIWETKDR